MPQTILALFGIVLASILALHQSRTSIQTERQTEAAEVQALAAEVAMTRMAELEALPFDQAVADGIYMESPTELTPIVGGGFTPPGLDPPGDDLDDANGTVVEAVYALRDGASGGIRLRTAVVVRYVQESDGETVTSTRTRLKRATVTVQPATATTVRPVRLTQLFSCGSYCTW